MDRTFSSQTGASHRVHMTQDCMAKTFYNPANENLR